MTNREPSPAEQLPQTPPTAELSALHDCAQLATLALQHAAQGEPVECGRVLRMLEVTSFPYQQLATRAYLLSVHIESFARAQWMRTHAARSSFAPPLKRSRRESSSPST